MHKCRVSDIQLASDVRLIVRWPRHFKQTCLKKARDDEKELITRLMNERVSKLGNFKTRIDAILDAMDKRIDEFPEDIWRRIRFLEIDFRGKEDWPWSSCFYTKAEFHEVVYQPPCD